MSEETANALQTARAKLDKQIEIFAPRPPVRENAIRALTASLAEFEAAVRADERERCGHCDNAIAARENEVSAREHRALLRESQANGTSGDIAYGQDKEAMKREAAGLHFADANGPGFVPEHEVIKGGPFLPDVSGAPIEPAMQPKFDSVLPAPLGDESVAPSHASLVAPELAPAGNVVVEPKTKAKSKKAKT